MSLDRVSDTWERSAVADVSRDTIETVRLLVDGQHTQGRLAVVEIVARSGEEPPLHAHTREDEVISVRRGAITLYLDGASRRCAAGDVALLPRGSEHTWRVDSGEATLLIVAMPAGLEGYYLELAQPVAPERRIECLITASARYGVELIGPDTATSRPTDEPPAAETG